MAAARYPIRFNKLSRVLFWGVFIRQHACFVELDAAQVRIQMDWAFRASFTRTNVVRAELGTTGLMMGLGVHGFGGRWLVNGSLDGMVTLLLEPTQRAYVLGLPVKLRELQLSLEEPEVFLAAVRSR